MAIRAKQSQIIFLMILMIAVNMVNLEDQFLSIPVLDSTFLATRNAIQNAFYIFPFQIISLDSGIKAEYFIIRSVGYLVLVVMPVMDMRIIITEMRSIDSVLLGFAF